MENTAFGEKVPYVDLMTNIAAEVKERLKQDDQYYKLAIILTPRDAAFMKQDDMIGLLVEFSDLPISWIFINIASRSTPYLRRMDSPSPVSFEKNIQF